MNIQVQAENMGYNSVVQGLAVVGKRRTQVGAQDEDPCAVHTIPIYRARVHSRFFWSRLCHNDAGTGAACVAAENVWTMEVDSEGGSEEASFPRGQGCEAMKARYRR